MVVESTTFNADRMRAASGLEIQLGGGIRSRAGLAAALEIAARAVIGSLAVTEPETVGTWLEQLGSDRITLADHRSSRCSVAGVPCTPMFATCPPGRIRVVASSKVAGTPTASMATSAPSPPVSLRTTSNASSRSVDGHVGASNLGLIGGDAAVKAMMVVGLYKRDPMIAESPIGPAPTTATTSPGRT